MDWLAEARNRAAEARAAYDRWRATWPDHIRWPDLAKLTDTELAKVTRRIRLPRLPCVLCSRTGRVPEPNALGYITCPLCNGERYI